MPSQILAMQFSDSVDCGFRTSTEITKSYGFQPCCFFGEASHIRYIHLYILYINIYTCFFLFMHVTSFSVFKLFFDINFHADRNSHLYEINIGELLEIFGQNPMVTSPERKRPLVLSKYTFGGSKRSSKNPKKSCEIC